LNITICYSKDNVNKIIDKLGFDLTEETHIISTISENKTNTYLVLNANILAPWINKEDNLRKKISFECRNAEKIELMLLSLDKSCISRLKVMKELKGKELSYDNFESDSIISDACNKLNIDAVILITIPDMGWLSEQKMSMTEINVKALSISTGEIIWKSFLKGYVYHDLNKVSDQIVIENMESKLYKLLENKLKGKI